jgi:hypothetical protein
VNGEGVRGRKDGRGVAAIPDCPSGILGSWFLFATFLASLSPGSNARYGLRSTYHVTVSLCHCTEERKKKTRRPACSQPAHPRPRVFSCSFHFISQQFGQCSRSTPQWHFIPSRVLPFLGDGSTAADLACSDGKETPWCVQPMPVTQPTRGRPNRPLFATRQLVSGCTRAVQQNEVRGERPWKDLRNSGILGGRFFDNQPPLTLNPPAPRPPLPPGCVTVCDCVTRGPRRSKLDFALFAAVDLSCPGHGDSEIRNV